MQLLLLRHGPAEPKSHWKGADAERPLSAEGCLQVKDVAASLAKLTVCPDLILTSPYARARETAEIVAGCCNIPDRLMPDERLAPGFGTKQLAKLLKAHGDRKVLVLVGHEPDLSDLVRTLTGGGRVAIRKAAVAQIHLPDPSELKGRLVALIVPTAASEQVAIAAYDGL